MRFIKFLLKLLLGLLFTLVLLLGVGVGAFYYVMNKPEVIVSEKIWVQVNERILKPMDILVSYKTFEVQILRKDEDWYQRQIIVRSTELKVAMPDLFAADIPDIDLHLLVNFHPKRYGIKTVGPIDMLGATVQVKLPKPDPKKISEPFDYQLWIDRLRQVKFEPIHLGLKKILIERPGEPKIEAQLYASVQKFEGRKWQVSLRADRVKGLPANRANFDVDLDLADTGDPLPAAVNIKGRADLVKLGWVQLTAQGQIDNKEKGQFRLELGSNIDRKKQQLRASGSLDKERFSLKVSGQAAAPVELLQTVEVEGCELDGTFRQKPNTLLQSRLNCKVAFTRVPAPAEKPFQDMLPKRFQFDIDGPIHVEGWDKQPSFNAPLTIVLTPLLGPIFSLHSTTVVKLSGKLQGGLEGLNADVDVKTQFSLDQFQTMVHRLSDTQFSIPAPFNTLNGRVYCNVEGRIQKKGTTFNLPIDCGSELASQTQSVFIQAQGTIEKEADKKPLIRSTIGLNKITFELPKLPLIGKVPQLFPDKRIVKAGDRIDELDGPTILPVNLDLKIATPADRPITLVTDLQPRPIPIGIDMTLKGDQIHPLGWVGIDEYKVTFLKKNAQVHRLRMVLVQDETQPHLDGRIQFDDPDVKIFLNLSGTMDRPFFNLESDPPRTPTELLSMIIYGGDPTVLDEDSQQTVADTNAAMVDGAIGLLSMYYLASTPIDSVGYNPQTGVFRARMRVAEGLTLMLGSDLNNKQEITLRKRLKESWYFETGAEKDEETGENKGVAMFKWDRRY